MSINVIRVLLWQWESVGVCRCRGVEGVFEVFKGVFDVEGAKVAVGWVVIWNFQPSHHVNRGRWIGQRNICLVVLLLGSFNTCAHLLLFKFGTLSWFPKTLCQFQCSQLHQKLPVSVSVCSIGKLSVPGTFRLSQWLKYPDDLCLGLVQFCH